MNEFPEGNGHFWWHTLLPFDLSRLQTDDGSSEKELPSSGSHSEAKNEVIPATEANSVALFETSNPASSNTVSAESIEELSNRMTRLEEKLEHQIGERMNAVEARLAGVEGKLDTMMAELRNVMSALLSNRSSQ